MFEAEQISIIFFQDLCLSLSSGWSKKRRLTDFSYSDLSNKELVSIKLIQNSKSLLFNLLNNFEYHALTFKELNFTNLFILKLYQTITDKYTQLFMISV